MAARRARSSRGLARKDNPMMTQTIRKPAPRRHLASKSGEFSFGSVLRRPETGRVPWLALRLRLLHDLRRHELSSRPRAPRAISTSRQISGIVALPDRPADDRWRARHLHRRDDPGGRDDGRDRLRLLRRSDHCRHGRFPCVRRRRRAHQRLPYHPNRGALADRHARHAVRRAGSRPRAFGAPDRDAPVSRLCAELDEVVFGSFIGGTAFR